MLAGRGVGAQRAKHNRPSTTGLWRWEHGCSGDVHAMSLRAHSRWRRAYPHHSHFGTHWRLKTPPSGTTLSTISRNGCVVGGWSLGTAIEVSYTAPAALRPAINGRLQADIEQAASLDGRTVSAMFDLYDTYYDATSRPLFETDLRNKDFVIALREPSGALAGFSTLAVLEAEIGGERLRAIYSGDTIIDHAHWGTQALAFTWIRFAGDDQGVGAGASALLVPDRQGASHLSLPFGVLRLPSIRTGTRRRRRRRARSWTSWRAGDSATAYDAERGVVSFPQSRGHLKPALGGDRAGGGGAAGRGVLPAQQSRLRPRRRARVPDRARVRQSAPARPPRVRAGSCCMSGWAAILGAAATKAKPSSAPAPTPRRDADRAAAEHPRRQRRERVRPRPRLRGDRRGRSLPRAGADPRLRRAAPLDRSRRRRRSRMP